MTIEEGVQNLESCAQACVIAGGVEARELLLARLGELGVVLEGNPDIFAREYGQFLVDDARQVVSRASHKPFALARSIFILTFTSMTREAQNALLKTLEEPGASVFFLITPAPDTLLPTLRSRMMVLSVDSSAASSIDTEDFLKAAPGKRLELLAPLVESKDVMVIMGFLAALERVLAKQVAEPGIMLGLRAILRARRYINDKGASVKNLLEQVALLTPLQK